MNNTSLLVFQGPSGIWNVELISGRLEMILNSFDSEFIADSYANLVGKMLGIPCEKEREI